MRTLTLAAIGAALLFAPALNPVSAADDANASIVGFAFVDASVTSQGTHARLPPGTKIYPSGSRITGTEGCPTNRYHTDGLLVLVFDYQGRPTAGSVTVVRRPDTGGEFTNAPYYLDIDPGRRLQYLGPIFQNGTYNVRFAYNYAEGATKNTSATISIEHQCTM